MFKIFKKNKYDFHDKLLLPKSDNIDINKNYEYFKSPYEHIIVKSFFNNY